jgi:hypothetical protein
LRRKFDKKAYLKTLRNLQKEFSKKYRVYLAESFNPRNWLRSKDVEVKLSWPKDPGEEYESFKRGRCKSLDFWFKVYTKRKKEYIFVIKYSPYYSPSSTIFFPSIYAHTCYYTSSLMISLGDISIVCKHVYAVLREIDEIAKQENIPIPESFFYPRDKNIFYRFESIEKDKKLTPKEKLKRTFNLLEEFLYINELPKLKILNQRLKYL